jgi:hypothetical protein
MFDPPPQPTSEDIARAIANELESRVRLDSMVLPIGLWLLLGDVEVEGGGWSGIGFAVDDEGQLVAGGHLDLDAGGAIRQGCAVVVAG